MAWRPAIASWWESSSSEWSTDLGEWRARQLQPVSWKRWSRRLLRQLWRSRYLQQPPPLPPTVQEPLVTTPALPRPKPWRLGYSPALSDKGNTRRTWPLPSLPLEAVDAPPRVARRMAPAPAPLREEAPQRTTTTSAAVARVLADQHQPEQAAKKGDRVQNFV